jgi:hypothetical protein
MDDLCSTRSKRIWWWWICCPNAVTLQLLHSKKLRIKEITLNED